MQTLIVDDSRAARAMVKRMLDQLGIESSQAEHGEEALRRLRDGEAYDALLVDWNMPIMDGLELVRALRAEKRFADLAVLMISSESDPRNIARALMAGADEYLVKPIDTGMLADKLRALGLLDEERV
ncbi:MAG: response regulator [Acidimicrobiales bacterium]|nr:response regulator [Acidimicrobiales bacterium]